MKQSQAREKLGTQSGGYSMRAARASHHRPARSPAEDLGPQGATALACQQAEEGRADASVVHDELNRGVPSDAGAWAAWL